MAKLIQLIHSVDHRGTGAPGDPIRHVEQLWTPEGVLIAERDQLTGQNVFTGVNPQPELHIDIVLGGMRPPKKP